MDGKKDIQNDTDFLSKLIVGIGEVSEITNIPQRQIRYWEAKGYIASVKGKTTTRRFDYKTIKKMLLIKELLEEGFTLESAVKKVENRLKMVEDAFKKLRKKTPK
jgi:MerR family transcriptional regulator, global nitrogen regulator